MTDFPRRSKAVTTRIGIDGLPALTRQFKELARLLPNALDGRPREIRRLKHLFNRSASCLIEFRQLPTTSANKIVILAKPSNGFCLLLSAVRADKLNLSVINRAFGHRANPSRKRRAAA